MRLQQFDGNKGHEFDRYRFIITTSQKGASYRDVMLRKMNSAVIFCDVLTS